MRTLKTTASGDLERDARGHLVVCTGAEAERVHAEIALRVRLGECPFDLALGLDASIMGDAGGPVPVNLEVERAVLKATGITAVIDCQTEVVETAQRAAELGVSEAYAENPRRITHTEVLLQGEHGGVLKIGLPV